MTLLLTGGAGFIGAHAALLALDAGRRVVVVDDLSTGFREAVPSGASFVQGDAGDARFMARVMRDHRVEAVMHFAASASAPDSVARPLDYYANNAGAVIGLLRACVDAGVGRWVLSSTAATYGEGRTRVDEDAPTLPVSPYGRSKLIAEAIVRDAAAAHGARAVALRFFNVAGADPEGRAGQSTADASHLFKVACRVALGRTPALRVHGDDWPTRDGTGVRDYVHVHDIARAHLLALKRLERVPPGVTEVFNLGTERGCSVREVAAAVGRAAGRALPIEIGPRRAGDVGELVADASRARSVLGWRPRFGVDETAAHALAWERRLPDLGGPCPAERSGLAVQRETSGR